MKKFRLMANLCKPSHRRCVVLTLLLVTMCFNMFAVYVSPPDNLRLVEDSDYVDLPVDNLLPLEEIMDSTEPQVVVAHIIGMWPYVYPLWVYLAEYQGQKFLIYPAERDEVFEMHGLADYVEEPYQDPYASCKTVEDIIKVIEEYTASKGDNTDIEFELSDTPETPLSGITPTDTVPDYSSEESDNAGDAKDGTCKIKLGKTYLFQVVPSKFFRKDLFPNCFTTPVRTTILMNSKYCFKALNLKKETVYPISPLPPGE